MSGWFYFYFIYVCCIAVCIFALYDGLRFCIVNFKEIGMQTFVPCVDFLDCANSLDRQRLGKQRVECYQILNSLFGFSKGWRNHPATRMWEENVDALAVYSLVCCSTWVRRGFEDSCYNKIVSVMQLGGSKIDPITECARHICGQIGTYSACACFDIPLPSWWGGPIHESHRKSLKSRLPEWYNQFAWYEEASEDPLYWPVNLLGK